VLDLETTSIGRQGKDGRVQAEIGDLVADASEDVRRFARALNGS
jgi:hypothetical protein